MLHRQQLQRPRVVAEGHRDGGHDVQRGDPAVRDELGDVGLAGVDDREITRQAVARGGVDEPLQARLERQAAVTIATTASPSPTTVAVVRTPPADGAAPASPIPASTAGQRPSGAWPPRRERGDGPARPRDDRRGTRRHRHEQQREDRPATQGDGPRRPEPRRRSKRAWLPSGPHQPRGERDRGARHPRGGGSDRTGQHPRHRALGEGHPQCALDALDVPAVAVVPQQPLRDHQEPAQPHDHAEHDQPHEEDDLRGAHRRVDAGGRERGLGTEQAVQRRGVRVVGVGGGQGRGEGVAGRRGSVDRQPDEHPPGRDVRRVRTGEGRRHDESVTGSAQVGARAMPTTRTRAKPPSGCPEPLGEPGDLLGQQQPQDHLVADRRPGPRGGLAHEDLVGSVGRAGARPAITTGSASPGGWSGPPLRETNRTAGVLIWAIQETGVQLAVTPGIVATFSKTVACAAGRRTCASATPIAAPSRA